MAEDDEIYTLSPLGLIGTAVSHEDAKRIMDTLELYVRRHLGLPGGVVFDEKGQAHFARLREDVLEGAGSAPAVQVEPVSLRQRLFSGWAGCSNHGCVVVDPKPGVARTNGICQCVVNASRSQLYMLQSRIQSLIATQQPAEQQPISHDWDDQDKCRRCGDRDWYASATCTPKQQTATDVEALVEALEQCITSMLDSGYRTDAVVIRVARSAIGAHRKQGGDVCHHGK